MPKVPVAGYVILLLLVPLGGCRKSAAIPDPGSKPYRDLVSSFYIGLAALQAGEDIRAKQGLTLATQVAPGEPAAWADLGLLELRQQQNDQSFRDVQTALTLAPRNSQLQALLGLVESKRGNLVETIAHLNEAVNLDPTNSKAAYALAQETERQGSPKADTDSRQLLLNILRKQPNNQAVLLDVARLSAKVGDGRSIATALSSLQAAASSWPAVAKHQLETIQATVAAGNIRASAIQVQFLRNLLVRDVTFRRDLDAIRPPAGTLGEPFVNFLRTQPPSSSPAPSDTALHFVSQLASPPASLPALWAGSLVLDSGSDARVVWADTSTLHLDESTTLPLPGKSQTSLAPNSIVFGDLNYDFKTDIVMATASGLRIYQQTILPLFTDVTSKAKLSPPVINASYTGAWLFDIDLDGDLDIVLGTRTGDPVVLRNNGDGSFAVIHPLTGIDGVAAFASADFDSDGVPDVALIDQKGKLKLFTNERLGNYRGQSSPLDSNLTLTSIATGDVKGDGQMDLLALTTEGKVMRLSRQRTNKNWEVAPLITAMPAQPARLLLADLDNNGSLDLIIGSQIFLHDATGFRAMAKSLDAACAALLDLNNDGRLDIVTLSPAGSIARLTNGGTKHYQWQTLRTRAAQTSGDQRINSFGIGGEVEIRSGLLTQKQSITTPILHFGLGDSTEVSLARIVWPNGQLQVEFDLKPDAAVLAQQRLKGSCPFLFAWDGQRMRFIKDCAPWSPALGLHINAQNVASIGQTQEWFKIPAGQFQPRNGFYDLRITAEYWETFYIDHYSFLAVDHPKGTEVFTDERFAVPAPPLQLYQVMTPHPFATAEDDTGIDVSETVRAIDAHYLDTFGRGQYQGVTRDHWVELELPADAPHAGPLYLIGSGWLHPTDATINVALGQSSRPAPQGLSIETLHADGTWRVAKSGLGFPAGRLKNIVLPLNGLFAPGAPRRLRLRTNLEVYWDRLAWAAELSGPPFRVQPLPLASAILGYRGFSRITQANVSSPEIPDYASVENRGPRWRDLEGYYTRYGDVRSLLEKIDDRMLITNAGDELRLKVVAAPPPLDGWTRDLIMIGDGWIKDGDFNSVFSRTVLPLPYHGMKNYTTDSPSLEQDPGYQRHPEDWKTFHTRYVGPEFFSQALWH